MKIGVHRDHRDPAPGKLDAADVLHFVVVQISVAGDNDGDLVFCRGAHRAEHGARDPFAVICGDFEFEYLHISKIRLEQRRTDAADKAQHQRDAQPENGRAFFLLRLHDIPPFFGAAAPLLLAPRAQERRYFYAPG